MSAVSNPRPETFFPMVRQISCHITPVLAQTPITPNQITITGLTVGLAGCYCISRGNYGWLVTGAALVAVAYILDHCDGELARLKGMTSKLGGALDAFADWALHATLIFALGFSVAAERGEEMWLWMGVLASAGATINQLLTSLFSRRRGTDAYQRDPSQPPEDRPESLTEHIIFAFRELARAEFWLLFLCLTLLGLAWVLLPLAAIGAQLYWLAAIFVRDKNFRV